MYMFIKIKYNLIFNVWFNAFVLSNFVTYFLEHIKMYYHFII